MSNAIILVNQFLAVKNSGVSCLTSIFYLSNPKMKVQHAENLFKFARFDDSCTFFSADRYEPVAAWFSLVKVGQDAWVQIPQVAETLCSPSAIFCGTEPVSRLIHSIILLRSL